jgi:hypothetical protein
VERVVVRVRQVDPKAHPYPSYLLVGPAGKLGLASRPVCRAGRRAHVRQSPQSPQSVPWYGPSLRPFPQSRIWASIIPTELSIKVVGRNNLDEVVALYVRVLVPSTALDWSTRGESAGDSGSLDPSEAPKRLHDLFNHEGAISCCVVPSPELSNRIALSDLQRDIVFRVSPFVTAGQLGLPWSVRVISAPQRN